MQFTRTVLLASIDHTLASVRAALAAGADPEQTDDARTQLSARAGADVARLPTDPDGEWAGVPPVTFEAIARAKEIAPTDLAEAERRLAAARETLGGPSS